MSNIKQFSEFRAKMDVGLARKRIKKGDLFLVTSPEYNNATTVKIERKKRAKLNIGTIVDVDDFLKFFEPVGVKS